MSKLKMKAKAGFTLVELLVVMLIIAILTVAMLPMFKEYICKAQYSAEALPVIGNLRTKIGLYYYDHGKLPGNPDDGTTPSYAVASWEFNQTDTEKYDIAKYTLGTPPQVIAYTGEKLTNSGKSAPTLAKTHFGDTTVLDVDYEDLKGRRSLPIDYVYYNIRCLTEAGEISKTDYAYVVGCFGSGEGLASRTGYAVCELNLASVGKKYVGVFERYKAKALTATESDACPYLYLSDGDVGTGNPVSGVYVYCPKELTTGPNGDAKADTTNNNRPVIVTTMEANGWKFSD